MTILKDKATSMAQDYYATSLEHVLGALERIDLLIQRQVHRARQAYQSDSEFQGLHISEQEIDILLGKPIGLPYWAVASATEFDNLSNDALRELQQAIKRRADHSEKQGIDLRLARLAKTFALSATDVDVLLICLASEIDLRYERLFAYLQDDVTKKRPSVELVLHLLYVSLEDKIEARQHFSADAPLFRYHLLELITDPAQLRPPLIGHYLKLDDRIVNYLLGGDEIDSRLAAYTQLIDPHTKIEDLHLSGDTKQRLLAIANHINRYQQGPMFNFHGPHGTGKQTMAQALCRQLGIKLVLVEGNKFSHQVEAGNITLALRHILRETKLQAAALYWKDFDGLLKDDKIDQRESLLQELEHHQGLVIIATDEAWQPQQHLQHSAFFNVDFVIPSSAVRAQLWDVSLQDHRSREPGIDLHELAEKFRLTGGQIEQAAMTAINLAHWRDPENPCISRLDLHHACRQHSNRKLTTLARKITPHYAWGDIVLPGNKLEQLRDICNHVKYRSLVFEQWGFERKLSLGKGLNILFAGPSGTGKTMSAEIIANELGLDLYKIDLSGVVSKYIGETEKNLARIFHEAETSNAILFFDEADALFGKRSEIHDAHDRHANIETSYLLQRIEEYEGIVILATNFSKNMDQAFVRRLNFSIEFPFPKAKDRRRIWERMWPDNTPRNNDMDLDFMAQHFEVAGGNIRNIALAAAFLAADDSGEVNMIHLIQATQREYQKMGKVIVDGEFGHYPKTMRNEANNLQ